MTQQAISRTPHTGVCALSPYSDAGSDAQDGQPGEEWTVPGWDEIVRTHAHPVYRLAYRLTGNQHDAEDLTQEVFIRVFRSLSRFRPGTFEGWLHRITVNLFLDMTRRRSRVRFEHLTDAAAERLSAAEPNPAQAHHDTRLDADVQAALDALPVPFRAAVVLCDVEGLSYEEVAATLGVKTGTVRSRIHRGRARLRTSLVHRAGSGTESTTAPTGSPGPHATAPAAALANG
ncbi:RNA polymerase sigma factor SigE [Streptomyces sp. TRM68367]|uniref:RNA polymerase sigma factor SigE n=1 Tax=Streptomyces sp. TRM68367 TaxID=2758415 RepID=UPI00165BDAEE|nr:RNA polymerase sigma factor SigE [Streptomyces sp. TRM68367]MBC9723931.1 RNA polymerase sigma factor SigE [Streptomyces sp. TRM68367]